MMARQPGRVGPIRVRRHAVVLACVASSLVIAATGPLSFDVLAQERAQGRPSALGAATIPGPVLRLDVPGMVIAAPASETALGIALERGAETPANSFVRIRGLAPQMTLTEGHMIAPGAWAVPLSALPGLRVQIPPSSSGRINVSIALVAIDGGVVAEAKTTLVVAPAALAPSPPASPAEAKPLARGAPAEPPLAQASVPRSPATVAALPPPRMPEASPSAPAPRLDVPQPLPLSPAVRDRSEGYVTRGRKLLEEGNVASARLFFRRAADEGLADGALALGATFDPAELERLRVIGIRPDPAEARRWYEKARDLGAGAAAERRLEKLGSG